MKALCLLFLFMAPQASRVDVQMLEKNVAESGRVLTLGTSPSQRLQPPARLAPGAPPLLSFRLLEGKMRHRYGKLDLVMDDAGH
jgi:hypothetical protein